MIGLGVPELIIISFILMLGIIPAWLIFSKAGFPGWYSLAIFIPFVGWLVPFFLAFANWPVRQELEELKKQGPRP